MLWYSFLPQSEENVGMEELMPYLLNSALHEDFQPALLSHVYCLI